MSRVRQTLREKNGLRIEVVPRMSDHDTAHPLRKDPTFLARLQEGDDAAFDNLIQVYGESLIRYATGMVDSVDTAQDVVQEVFLRLWRERSHLDRSWDIAAYLYGLTRQRALNVVRTAYTTTQREQRWALQQTETFGAAAIDITAEDAADARVMVWNALAGVSPRCREVFMLVWDDELPYIEIAQRMGLTESTVRSYMSRALKQLIEVVRSRDHL